MTTKIRRAKFGPTLSGDEKAALIAFSKRTKALSSPKGDDIVLKCEVDLSDRYTQIFEEIKSYLGPIDLGTANKIHTSLLRAVPKAPKKVKSRVSLTSGSIIIAADILGEVVRRFSLRAKDRRILEALIKRCGSTLAIFASVTSDGLSWGRVVRFFQSAASSANLNIETFLSEEDFGETFTRLKSGVVNSLGSLLESGNTSGVRQLLGACACQSELEEACRGVLKRLLSERAGILPRESQQIALRFLSIDIESGQVDYANPAESPQIREAAGLLLFLYDVRQHTPELEEAFDRYRKVSERQFNLQLRGVVGSTMAYDPRLHELTESLEQGLEVTLLRPWVEWYKPPDR
jgi:hypothetical protein